MPKRVLSVGQCSMDHGSLSRFLGAAYEAAVDAVDDGADAARELAGRSYDLVLVNRVLDRDGGDGVALVGELATDDGPPVMLVSNYADAQQRAVAAGAVPGFGKSELGSSSARSRLDPILGTHEVDTP